MSKTVERCVRHAAAVLLAAVLCVATSGCTDPTEAGAGGQGTGGFAIAGRVDGFGSVVVEGERLDDRAALVSLEENPAAPVSAPLSSVRLGAQLVAQASTGSLQKARVAAEVIGPLDVDVINEDLLIVLGQRVRLNAHPVIRPVYENLEALAATSIVEVHGLRLANGDLLATRVQARSTADTALRLAGNAVRVDATARTFFIGAQRVSYAGARVLPEGAQLAEGRRVVAFAPGLDHLNGGTLRASVISLDGPAQRLAPGELRGAGLVTRIDGPGQFVIGDLLVDARNATTSGEVALDRFVRVRGQFADGLLRARTVEVLPNTAPLTLNVAGAITDFSGADNLFRLRGANVRVDAQTQWRGGSADNLANGVRLSVAGTVDSGDLRAARVELQPGAPVAAGTIGSIDRATGLLRLSHGVRVRLSDTALLRNGARADVAEGRRVRVAGRAEGDVLLADELTFLDSVNAPLDVLLVGVTSNLVQGGVAFYVGDTLVQINAQTQFVGGRTGTVADFDDGIMAVVRAVRQGGVLLARRVELRFALEDNAAVAGHVEELGQDRRFVIAGQRVDAGNASIIGSVPGGLRNNAFVLVEGDTVNGVVAARRVEVLD